MDAMEDVDLLSGSNTHLSKVAEDGNGDADADANPTLGTIPAVVAQQHQQPSAIPTSGVPAAAGGQPQGGLNVKTAPFVSGANSNPGVKYRHVGKSGLQVSNIALGQRGS